MKGNEKGNDGHYEKTKNVPGKTDISLFFVFSGNIVAETTRQQQSKRCPCIDKDKAKTDNESQYNVIHNFQAKSTVKVKKNSLHLWYGNKDIQKNGPPYRMGGLCYIGCCLSGDNRTDSQFLGLR